MQDTFDYQPSENKCKEEIERIDRSIYGFIVYHGNIKTQFYDFNSARNFRDKVNGTMKNMLIDTAKEIHGIDGVK
jgi:hypothetical protein